MADIEQKLRALPGVSDAGAADRMSFEFGPPEIVKPPRELLGEMLLENSQPGPAEEELRKALERQPGRAASLRSLARAAAASGDTRTARRAEEDYRRVRHRADAAPAASR